MNINFDTIINFLQEVNQRFAITSLFEEREVGHILNQQELIIVLIILVVGLLWCFAGLLMVRFWAALLGFGLGFTLGVIAGSPFTMDGLILAICGGVLGLIFGIYSARILPLGTFLVVLLSVFALTALLLGANNFMMLGISLAVALLFAIISFKLPAPIVIIVTSICGALISAETLGILVNYNLLIYVVVAVALAVGGMCTQFLFENGKRKRQHLERAHEIKESKAEDIEKARNLVEDLDGESELGILMDSELGKKDKPKKEKAKKEKSKKSKKDQIQIVFDNLEDDEELNYKGMNVESQAFDGELGEQKYKEESEKKELKSDDSEEKQKGSFQGEIDHSDLKGAEDSTAKLPIEGTEPTNSEMTDIKEGVAVVEDIQGEKIEELAEEEGKSKVFKESNLEQEAKVKEEESNLVKPKMINPQDDNIVKNIQVEEEVERKTSELERAKRDWINQLISDKEKDDLEG